MAYKYLIRSKHNHWIGFDDIVSKVLPQTIMSLLCDTRHLIINFWICLLYTKKATGGFG